MNLVQGLYTAKGPHTCQKRVGEAGSETYLAVDLDLDVDLSP